MVYKQPKSRYWWYKFTWKGRLIRKSTKQTNKRIAEQMEAAYRTALAKGEVGLIEPKKVPTLADFLEKDFIPFYRRTKGDTEPNTVRDYESGAANLNAFPKLARLGLDEIDHDAIQAFIAHRQAYRQKRRAGQPLSVASINHDLRTLRRALHLAVEWGRVRAVTKVRLLPGERHRERALSEMEDRAYIEAATVLAQKLDQDYDAALKGIRALVRGEQPRKPDSYRLRDIALLMLDAGLRPDECFRLTSENVHDGAIWIFEGKTPAARRRVPLMTPRLQSALDMRLGATDPGGWLFPNPDTATGHIAESSVRDLHAKAVKNSGVLAFELYILRHTCLTRWGEYMDPFKLHKYAGHTDMKTTMRYVHPKDESMEEAMEQYRAARKARAVRPGHTCGHTTLGTAD
jgi:integrase